MLGRRDRRGDEPRRGPHPARAFVVRGRAPRCAPTRSPRARRRRRLAIKLDPETARLPAPSRGPHHEIWVYSPRVEGVHLRGGDIARGGIRWSDRRDDFRTEVLGLMKAQTAKNAVIVPVGAKGGFVVKRPPAEPSAAGRGARVLPVVRPRHARPHRQPGRRCGRADRDRPKASCATTATTPTSSSPPTRAPRRSPTSPTSSRRSTATGSATPSRPVDRRATTTRRWASRRAAHGSRCVRTSVPWASTPTPPS